jgi:hypothetical protein
MARFRPCLVAPFAIILATVLQAPSASGTPVDLGIDASVEIFHEDDNTAVQFSLPAGGGPTFTSLQPGFRIGFLASPRIMVEPAIGFSHYSQDGESLFNFRFSMSFLSYFNEDRTRPQPYVRIGAGARVLGGDSESDTQLLAGGGLGLRTPIAGCLATRVEANYSRALESDVFSAFNVIDVRFGFSFTAGD